MQHNIPEEQRYQQVIQLAIMNCFCNCDNEAELNTQSAVMSINEEVDYAFHEEWIWLRKKDIDFGYVSVDNELAMCGIGHQ
jgi:hypothetical protein